MCVFPLVPDTWNSGWNSYEARYMVYANNSTMEGYSHLFEVKPRSQNSIEVQLTDTLTLQPNPIVIMTPAKNTTGRLVPTSRPLPQNPTTTGFIINGMQLTLTGNTLFMPEGSNLANITSGGKITIPVQARDNNTSSSLIMQVSPINRSAASVENISLVVRKNTILNGGKVTVCAIAELNGLPRNYGLKINVTSHESADNGSIAGLPGLDSENRSFKVLAVVEISRENLTNGRDIKAGSLTLTIPRPPDFDPSGTYKAIRESDGNRSLLDARLIGSQDADLLTFEIDSPGGFSTFTLLEVIPQSQSAEVASVATVSPDKDDGFLRSLLINIGVVVIFLAFVCLVIYRYVLKKN